GFLSTLAVGKEEFFQPGNEKYRDALLEEKRLLLHLAERGCTLRCIISPTEIDVRTHRLPHAMQRLRNLISFLKSNHPAHQNIYWVISPFRQQNSYIIGSLCFSQGFKSEVVHGYPLTLRQTNAEAIRSATDLQQVLFERLRSHTLAAFPSRHRDERKGLRMSTLRCLEQALRWCESAADANKPKPRSRRK
ncbi:MAG: hypothetical protein JNK48_29230, partial [Bryobacterales bacterium]|nr:hypothetical protein [Bryobacterales bacterium]